MILLQKNKRTIINIFIEGNSFIAKGLVTDEANSNLYEQSAWMSKFVFK